MPKRTSSVPFLLVCAAFVFSACTPDLPTGPDPITDPALATYASRLNIDLATFTVTSSGLYLKDVPAGWGTAVTLGDTVSVDYVGYFTNGAIFDSNRQKGDFTATFVVNDSAVIKGWTEGLQGMRVGGKRKLIVPPSLGYGEVGNGSVPPNTILVFDITLHGVR
jgi:peptidylprolyl isomerase